MAKVEFSDPECYAVSATGFLILVRGMKQMEVNNGAGLPKWLLNLLLRGLRNWNLGDVDSAGTFFGLHPDEFIRIGRIVRRGLTPYPAPGGNAGGFFVPASEKISYGQTFFWFFDL